jgi:hypothetical protein
MYCRRSMTTEQESVQFHRKTRDLRFFPLGSKGGLNSLTCEMKILTEDIDHVPYSEAY